MTAGLLGQIATPAAGNRVQPDVEWIADNAVFAGKYPGDAEYLAWLANRAHLAAACRFVVAPDVVADAAATLALSLPMLPRIRALGFPAALVAQDGLEDLDVPWGAFDCLFIGGSTEWKLGPAARLLVAEAKRRGKWVHMGRVNSRQRIQYAAAVGCDSVDGTYLAFGPDRNLPTLASWLRELEWPTLFSCSEDTVTTTPWKSVPWREADHRNHPSERHRCRCRCEAMTDRLCPEHGEASTDFPPGWLVAAAVAIGDGRAEPEDLRAAVRVLHALRREGALRRLDLPAEGAA